jgi:hypothetical protein
LACSTLLVSFTSSALGGTLAGYVRDQNWFAQYQSNPSGVGYYEYAVNANASGPSAPGGAAATDVFGAFSLANLAAGTYTVASWDVWWRSAYAFNVTVPASGTSATVDLRLKATMWGYPAFWDSTGYHEFGQTFVATGPISMIYLRAPFNTAYTLTIRTNGPGSGRLAGTPDRSFSGAGDHRLIFGYGEMPTVAGQTYYARIRTSSPAIGGVLMQMDPRPDYSDPMPGGCLWLGDGTTMTAYPDRDLGLVIMADDDGLITNLSARQSGAILNNVTSAGQTFIARGVHLVSAAAWLADASAPAYSVRVLQNGPGGAQIGPARQGKPARLGADPEMIVTWAPGECPLVPGQTYYLEITRQGGGTFNSVYANNQNPFAYGQAYSNGTPLSGTDLAGTLMEEASAGSATLPEVRILSGPTVLEPERLTNRLTIRWNTDLPSDSRVEYAVEHPPYTLSAYAPQAVLSHSLVLTGLQSHTLYHYRVTSSATGRRAAVSRDFVICTRPAVSNLLVNPSFEEGSGASPRTMIPGWVKFGGVDIRAADGTWFWGLQPTNGAWLCQGAVNAGSSDGGVYQRVAGVMPGREYTFSAWVMTAPRENNTWKYDVWNAQGRLIYMRLGLDPTGATNPAAATVRWTPRMYSHRRYTNLGKTVKAQNTNLTVFVSMKGDGVEWHNYALDHCVLSGEEIPTKVEPPTMRTNGAVGLRWSSRANRTNLLEVSTNLASWATRAGLLNLTGVQSFEDDEAPGRPQRFYRVKAP